MTITSQRNRCALLGTVVLKSAVVVQQSQPATKSQHTDAILDQRQSRHPLKLYQPTVRLRALISCVGS